MMGIRLSLGTLLFAVLAFGILAAGCAQAPAKGNETAKPPPIPPPPVQPSQPPPAAPPPAQPPSTPPPAPPPNATYDPKINPADFTTSITNKYFSLVPGKKMTYKSETEDGTETVEVYVTNQTRTVMGVKTVVVWDRVWLEGDLIEDTMDYYAQNAKTGDVWYFGEDTKEMAGGVVTTTSGSWEAGVDGAKPGIIAEANPKVGDSYRQEYYAGEAEDMADVLALNESVSVPFGSFGGCLKTRDWTPLEPGADEHKYYCTSVGGVVLEVVVEDGEREELTGVEYNSQPSPPAENPPPAETNITEGQAEQIALERVPGTVTDIAIETKFGKPCYVVEIDPVSGPETDVIIDMKTGEVLAVET